MTPRWYNIVVPQGGKYELNLAIQNSDKTVKNLTGYSGRMQVRATVDSTVVLMEATTANGRISIDAVNGEVSIIVGADVTAAMTWSSGQYDLELFTADPAEVLKPLRGYAYLLKEITR